ncbi:MAG: oligopeptide transporter, OPT family, partial [Phycisphaerales bacterium]
MREFSPLAIGLGILIGVLFGMANAFTGLQLGMTVSASIPAAVISMGILRGLMKRGTILENNMVQTIGSAGEGMAAGMIFTIPALLIFQFEGGEFQVTFMEMVIWASIGGLLGVLFMVPLRRALIVKEHGRLPYPEGVACAEVLESGDRGGAGARTVFSALGVGAAYSLIQRLGFWREKATVDIAQARTEAGMEVSPALLGVGYILGPRIAGYMLAGAVLGWFVIIPLIGLYGEGMDHPVFPEAEVLIADMDPEDIWEQYIRYIGAGAVVFGGLLSLIKSTPTIVGSIWQATTGVFSRAGGKDRTQRDIPFPILVILIAALGYAMYRIPAIRVGAAGAICVLVFGFFFVTVSSRLVGLVGSSSNPASGMTIATLLGTAIIFTYVLGMEGDAAKFTAVSVGAIVCIAICIAGDCSQDLKTGFLVRATPVKQQIGEIIGVLTATAALALTIKLLNNTYGFVETDTTPTPMPAYQANIMKMVVEGVMDQNLPWILVLSGAAAALVVELLGIPSLPFAVGLYLPLSLSSPIMVGGVLRWVIDKWRKPRTQAHNPGILAASGLVAGYGLVGIFCAGVVALIASVWNSPRYQSLLMDEPKPVVTDHFQPWLAETLGFDMTYGLGEKEVPPTTQPPTTQPAATEPEATEPMTDQPTTAEPVADPSATTQPAATQPAGAQPVQYTDLF